MHIIFLFLLISQIYCQYHDGDIRLVGGSYQWEGRVEIYFSGTWGTITDSQWTSDDAQTVCRKMGHFRPGATAHSLAYFGEGSGLIHLNSVECSGLEYSLTDCMVQTNDVSSGEHSLDVGVKCQPADGAYREGDIRLMGGEYNWEGRVEIYWMGDWGAISDSTWTSAHANVTCRQLQHTANGVVSPCCAYGEGSGKIHNYSIVCIGTEANITQCSYINNTVITSAQQDVVIKCQQDDEVKEGDIRLVGSSDFQQGLIYGRVEIFLSGVWGTVSSYGEDTEDARVVCRQLGYNTYADVISICCGFFVGGIGKIHFKNLLCAGSEYRLSNCQHDNNTAGLSHLGYWGDWGVNCTIDGPETGDVRRANYQRVRVYLSETWNDATNSSIDWTKENSEVVCRQLGYPNRSSFYLWTPRQITSAQIDNVNCTGTETKLTDCPHIINNIESYTFIGVICQSADCKNGDMRLVGGETEAEGRVEICRSKRWGTVCGNYWTEMHTAVVCRWFGFSDIIGDSTYFTSERFGQGTGPIFMDYVNCTGTEPRLWGKCMHFTHYYGCSHHSDIGISCLPASCSNGQLRLIEGTNERSGRVELCFNQRWETLTYHQWSTSAAKVVCNELGFSDYYLEIITDNLFGNFFGNDHFVSPWVDEWNTPTYIWTWNFGNGGGPIHPQYYQCTGTEQRLSQCGSYNITSHSDAVGLICKLGNCTDGEVRLEEGETEWEGRLEVCYSGRWGTVSSEGWTQINTQVVCNDLGYDISGAPNPWPSIPQSPSKPVYLQNIACPSTALTLTECAKTRYSSGKNDIIEVVISCQQPSCSDGDLKLVGGSVASEGRLEICFDKRWTTIDGDGWTLPDTQVACKQLGYPTSDTSHVAVARSSEVLPVLVSHFGCYGTEDRLTDCTHEKYSGTASNSKDVRISCIKEELFNSPVTPNTTSCENCESDYSEDKNSNSITTEVLAASVAVAALCFLAVIGLVLRYFIRALKRKKEQSVGKGNTNDDGATTVSDKNLAVNVSYVPNTMSSLGGKPMNYEMPSNNQSQPSCRQSLPPIPLTQLPTKQVDEHDHIMEREHIYDTCK